MKTLAERIVYLRETLLRLTQVEFAKKIGVTRGAVGNWELGGQIRPKNLMAISKYAQVSLDWLVNGEGETPAPQLPIKDVTEVTVRVMASMTGIHWSDREIILVADIIREFYARQQFAPGLLRTALEQLQLDIQKVLLTGR
jgi:transcriptional regulator with XRE-family HTH domain